LWRWARSADGLESSRQGSRLSETWVFMRRLAQQTVQCELPTPDVLTAVQRLLDRVTDDLPAEDIEIRKVLQTLFHRFEYEPQLYKFVSDLITEREDDAVDDTQSRVHKRVVTMVQDLLPTFRNLHKKVMPEQHKEHESPQDRRRIFACATPQRAVNRQDEGVVAEELGATNPEDFDAQSLSGSSPARSDGQRSFSVRSRSPPLQVDSFAGSECKSRDSRSLIEGMREPSSTDSLLKNCFPHGKPAPSPPDSECKSRDSRSVIERMREPSSTGSSLLKDCFPQSKALLVPDSVDASMSGEDVE